MFTTLPETAQDVTRILESKYDSMIASGKFTPFLYPWGSFGAAVVIFYLSKDHRSSPTLERLRFPIWLFNALFSIYCVLYTRARNPAAAFGVGLISAWSILWTATIVVLRDCQTDFRRIERREKRLDDSTRLNGDAATTTGVDGAARADLSDGKVTRRSKDVTANGTVGSTQAPAQRHGTLAWQSYPKRPMIERLDWVADIFTNFRGMGWDWRISGLPAPPDFVQRDMSMNESEPTSSRDTHVSRTGIHRYHSPGPLLRRQIYIFIRNYLILDFLKTLVAHDPYFWGVIGILDAPSPGYLPSFLSASPVFVKSTRLLISLAAISYALEFIFSLGPIVFVGIMGPRYIGVRGEAWMYPDHFGSFDNVLDKGLAGWWGGWWHQTFRFAFQVPGNKVVEALGWSERDARSRLVQAAVAFSLSGLLHMCGSYTQIGETTPVRGPLCFFLSQIVGVVLQMGISAALKKIGAPRWMTRIVNFVYTHVWFYHTAPLLVDDFARGGVWLFEPVPISIFRGLGLGSKHDGVWQWYGTVAKWHSGKHWWDSGIAL